MAKRGNEGFNPASAPPVRRNRGTIGSPGVKVDPRGNLPALEMREIQATKRTKRK